MPPLPADSIHARACKLKCEKILTRPTVEKVVLPFSRESCSLPRAGGVRHRPTLSHLQPDVYTDRAPDPADFIGSGAHFRICYVEGLQGYVRYATTAVWIESPPSSLTLPAGP